MTDQDRGLEDLLGAQLRNRNFDLVDLVPIPAHSDRMVRLRTLQDALEELDRAGPEGTVGYLLQIRPSRAPTQPSATANLPLPDEMPEPGKVASDPVYLADGKLNIPYLMRNAELLYGVGDYTLARNVYKAVLGSGEHTALALLGTARCLQAEGKLEAARTSYEESLAYQPSLEAYRQLGSLLMAEGRHAHAAETFERALGMKEVSSTTKFELCKAAGNCWARAARPIDAQRLYLRALELDPSADEIRANLGAVHLANGKYADAKRYFNDALASNPRNAAALSGLGSCFLAEGDKAAAHDSFARSLEIDLNNPDAVYYLVKIGYELKSYAAAARVLEEYIQIAPVNTNLMYSLAGLQFHLGRMDCARATLERIQGLQPGHVGATELMEMIARYSGAATT